MKKILLSVILLPLVLACSRKETVSHTQSLQYFKPIDSLLRHRDFFSARTRYDADKDKMNELHQLMASSLLDHAFNRLDSSNLKINRILQKYRGTLADSSLYRLLIAKQINHGKLCEYQEAFVAMDEAIATFGEDLPRAELQDIKNTRLIWKSLIGQPKQEVIIAGSTSMQITRDKAGLANLTVHNERDSLDFIFDTGANISTVTATTARRFNMIMMDSLIDVLAITGANVKSGIAVCPEFRIGNITVRNAIFLVLADSALAVPQLGYQINGILGFPVIEAMREIQLTRNGTFIVPQQRSTYAYRNLALDFLTPIIELDGESFTFDTGANKTILYKAYFQKHQQHIVSQYKQREVDLGGAGGSVRRNSYLITFTPTIDKKPVPIDSVLVLEENMMDDADELYGNIGQDLITKFGKMTLNFESMFVHFE